MIYVEFVIDTSGNDWIDFIQFLIFKITLLNLLIPLYYNFGYFLKESSIGKKFIFLITF